MSEPRNKKDRENGLLSGTSQAFLRELWRREKYGRAEYTKSKYTEKGILTEDACISMLTRKTDKLFFKNTERREDEYFTGECDIAPIEWDGEDTILDAKSCWSLKTFMEAELTKLYEYQGRGYMRLWNVNRFVLVYFLVNAPEHLIDAEIRRETWNCQTPEEYKEIEKRVRKNMTFDDIPEKDRVKFFKVERCFKEERNPFFVYQRCVEYSKTTCNYNKSWS